MRYACGRKWPVCCAGCAGSRRLQVVNADVPERDFWQVVLGSAAVTQQLCTVAAGVCVPVHLRLGLLAPRTLLLLDVALLLIGAAHQQAVLQGQSRSGGAA